MYITKRINGRVVPNEELGEDLVAHESTVAQVFYLRRTFQLSTHQLCGICFEDTARRTRGCRCEAIKPISTVHSTSSMFDHVGRIYRPNFREKKFFLQKLRALPPLQVTSYDEPKQAARYR